MKLLFFVCVFCFCFLCFIMNNIWLPCKLDQAHMHTLGLYQGYQTMHKIYKYVVQGLSQDLETGCLKSAIVKFLGVQIFKGGNNILKFQP